MVVGCSTCNETQEEKQSNSQYDSKVIVRATQSTNHGVGDVQLRSSTGALVSLEKGFTTLVEGSIKTVEPTSGHFGTKVVVTGERLLGGGKKLVTAELAGVKAQIVAAVNNKVSLVVQPHPTALTGDVVFTAETGALVTAPKAFSYVDQGKVATVTPSKGQVGTLVQIAGKGLRGGSAKIIHVSLANTEASIVNESDSLVSVISAHAAATGAKDRKSVV